MIPLLLYIVEAIILLSKPFQNKFWGNLYDFYTCISLLFNPEHTRIGFGDPGNEAERSAYRNYVRLSVDSSLFSRIFIKCGSLGGKQGTFIWRTRIRIDQILKLNFWILRSPAAETLDKNLTLILKFSKYKSTIVYKRLSYF